jgi:hypothetical protein
VEPKVGISVATGATSTAISGIFGVIAGTFVPTADRAQAGGGVVRIGANWDEIIANSVAIAVSCVGIIGSSAMGTADRVVSTADPTA